MQHPLFVIVGPTASGKTAYSVDLALQMMSDDPSRPVEIINADSRQLYKHLNIGTAKITEDEKRGVVHHLFDVLEPTEEITAAQYKQMAEELISDIHSRKSVPMLVGGSMLYISAIVDGLQFAGAADPALRKKLEAQYDEDEGESLYKELMELDSDAAAGIEVRNKPYVVRAIELLRAGEGSVQDQKDKKDCPYALNMYGMQWPREQLVERINARTRQLLSSGWIEEVQHLLDAGRIESDPAMKSHGYREIMGFLTRGEPSSLDELTELIAAKTRQYAKRQMTWWRKDERIQWISMSS